MCSAAGGKEVLAVASSKEECLAAWGAIRCFSIPDVDVMVTASAAVPILTLRLRFPEISQRQHQQYEESQQERQ